MGGFVQNVCLLTAPNTNKINKSKGVSSCFPRVTLWRRGRNSFSASWPVWFYSSWVCCEGQRRRPAALLLTIRRGEGGEGGPEPLIRSIQRVRSFDMPSQVYRRATVTLTRLCLNRYGFVTFETQEEALKILSNVSRRRRRCSTLFFWPDVTFCFSSERPTASASKRRRSSLARPLRGGSRRDNVSERRQLKLRLTVTKTMLKKLKQAKQ